MRPSARFLRYIIQNNNFKLKSVQKYVDITKKRQGATQIWILIFQQTTVQ